MNVWRTVWKIKNKKEGSKSRIQEMKERIVYKQVGGEKGMQMGE